MRVLSVTTSMVGAGLILLFAPLDATGRNLCGDATACIAAGCDLGDTDCEEDCCRDACKELEQACKEDAHERRHGTKKQCKVNRAQSRVNCEETYQADLLGCRAVACSNDPNSDPGACRKAAQQARKDCKWLAHDTRDQCKTDAIAASELDRATCEVVAAACEAGCAAP